MPSQPIISVILADQHSVVRAGVASVLGHGRFRVLGACGNGRDAVRLVRRFTPDVIISDIPMPLLNGLEAARQISSLTPLTRVLLLSAIHNDYEIEQAYRAKVGGYLLKSTPIEKLPAAVRSVAGGSKVYSPEVEWHIKRHKTDTEFGKEHPSGLSGREIEVIQLIAESFSNKRIASELGISEKTVDTYRQSLMKKLKIHDTAGLTRYAVGTGITQGK